MASPSMHPISSPIKMLGLFKQNFIPAFWNGKYSNPLGTGISISALVAEDISMTSCLAPNCEPSIDLASSEQYCSSFLAFIQSSVHQYLYIGFQRKFAALTISFSEIGR